MRFEVICRAKMDGFFGEAVREYEKRLKPYCKITLCSLHKAKNGDRRAETGNRHILLAGQQGERLDSQGLARKIERFSLDAPAYITVMTEAGPPLPGESAHRICVSQMDMDERLIVVILYEQIYRAFRIWKGEPYHH